MDYSAIIQFWFEEIDSQRWWQKDPDFDRLIRERFSAVHACATRCELYLWRRAPLGRLAEIILLDQFSRHIYRDQPLAFAFDAVALALAQEAIAAHTHDHLTPAQKSFLYLPFMHSESRQIHQIALQLFSEPGLAFNLKFEYDHQRIIERFGRYPHRNQILGRPSTPEEIQFLQEPGSSFN